MSQKITSKNLSYDSSLPPFLAALHAQTSNTTGPDPLLAKHRRAVKKRSASEEAEDIPLVVDEQGNTVAVEVGKDGAVKETAQGSGSKEDEETEREKDDEPVGKKQEAKAGFGARKRKTGRVVGNEEGGDDVPKMVESKASKADDTGSHKDMEAASDGKEKKPKKKAKKIKLSFDDGE